MFGKLKDALKKSISIFSKKVEEEVQPEVKEKKPEKSKEEKKPEPKKEQVLRSIKEVAQEPPKSKKKEVTKKEIKEPTKKQDEPIETVIEPVIEQVNPEPVEEKKIEEVPEQKLSFFKHLFKKSAEQKVEAKVIIEQALEIKVKPIQQPEVKSEVKKGIFAKAKEILTTTKLSDKKFEELFLDLELALLENNVAVEVISKIKNDLRAKLVEKTLPRNLEQVIEQSLRQSMNDILSFDRPDIIAKAKQKKPLVIAFFGINGSGKTTTIAKVAKFFQEHKLSCVMAAGDTFRAAAIQQLEEHANNLNIRLIKHDYGADAAAVAFDAIKFAQKSNIDIVLIDTAGRLHNDTNLMDELKKIVKVAKPDLKIFVGESITGNDCIEQSRQFDAIIGIDGIILTKTDVDQKGGTALSISYMTKKPIIYMGTGQGYDDLQPFTKELILSRLGLATET